MKKKVLLYGLMVAVLAWFLKLIDYRLFIRDISIEIYIGLVAAIFTVFGIWMGLRFTRPKLPVTQTFNDDFSIDEEKLKRVGISRREYDVLELIARGLSNKEIADTLFISMNTVKTHVSNLYMKLNARRRVQALQHAKQLGLLP